MVENSLGRVFSSKLKAQSSKSQKELADKMNWKYFLPDAEQSPEVQEQLSKQNFELEALSFELTKFLDKTVTGLIQKKDLNSA